MWRGNVASLGGSWTVPRILKGSPAGSGSTWIGAQAPGPRRAFIQLGSIETESSAARPGAAPRSGYQAFWSDARHRLHPQTLFNVNPGDDLTANLAAAGRHWKLAIVDRSSGAARFVTSDEAASAFNRADWTQENRASGEHRPDPYPRLTAVEFRGLAINSAPPSPSNLSALWMSVGGNSVAPGPLSGDSFRLGKAPRPSAAGAQFLHITEPVDAAANAFYARVAGWTAKTPYSEVASASAKFAGTLRGSIAALVRTSWPAPAQAAAKPLIDDMRSLLGRVVPPAPASRVTLAAWSSALAREGEGEAVSRAEDALRRILNVPFVPSS
jgi:hypothetical protein